MKKPALVPLSFGILMLFQATFGSLEALCILSSVVCTYGASSCFNVPVQDTHISHSKPFYLRRSLGNEHWHRERRNVIASPEALEAMYFSPGSK